MNSHKKRELCNSNNCNDSKIINSQGISVLNPFHYIKCFFEHLQTADIQQNPNHLDDLSP